MLLVAAAIRYSAEHNPSSEPRASRAWGWGGFFCLWSLSLSLKFPQNQNPETNQTKNKINKNKIYKNSPSQPPSSSDSEFGFCFNRHIHFPWGFKSRLGWHWHWHWHWPWVLQYAFYSRITTPRLGLGIGPGDFQMMVTLWCYLPRLATNMK